MLLDLPIKTYRGKSSNILFNDKGQLDELQKREKVKRAI
jgi:hypothetical protein